MILRERYKKEMEHIVVTEQLKNKVIAQIEKREKQPKRKSFRPAYVAIAAASVLLAISLHPTMPTKEKEEIMVENTQGEDMVKMETAVSEAYLAIHHITYNANEQKLHFSVTNKSNGMISFGYAYVIERYDETKQTWQPTTLTNDLAFIEMLALIGKGQTVKDVIDLSLLNQPLANGKYRIVRTYYADAAHLTGYIEFDVIDQKLLNFHTYIEMKPTETSESKDVRLTWEKDPRFSLYSAHNGLVSTRTGRQGLHIYPMYEGNEQVNFSMEASDGTLFTDKMVDDATTIHGAEQSVSSDEQIIADSMPPDSGQVEGMEGYVGPKVLFLNGERVNVEPSIVFWEPKEESKKEEVKVKVTVINARTNESIGTFYVVIVRQGDEYMLHHIE
ncbi:immunoglobulin-like domain-containing protein [Anoxybacillus tengchongensis]|uniref:immunoglobulin-like domain-containing protein n=1 Tax=Anoxybacillus tengchongensis TaxID=576944 RepID=UPI001606362C|nr:immunoglobulin-like domain-containing protein [Anoxybacillus tengchongensis]